jgi:hypothetical protein
MATGIAGYPGYVRITGSPDVKVKGINSMDLPYANQTDDTTAFDATTPGWTTSIPTLTGLAIKISGKRIPGDAGQLALRNGFMNKTLVPAVKLSPDGTEIHTVDVWVTAWDQKSDVKSAQTLDITLLVEGASVIS